jgi:hypothetical protein
MMDDFVPFGSAPYFVFLALLIFARGTDFLSTWVATPNLVLEANPIAKKFGWKWGIPLNVALCIAISVWPLPAIVISTASVLVAARNFQNAWLMRAFGEEAYRAWHRARIQEIGFSLYLVCLFGQTLLTAAVGGALVCLSPDSALASAIGWGILAYAAAVTFYTLLSLWRLRRSLG